MARSEGNCTASRRSNRLPSYRLHKPSGRAGVTLGGRDFYLGPHGSDASKAEYNRLVAEWVSKGRPSMVDADSDVYLVGELLLAYWEHAKRYYRKNGKATTGQAGIKAALRHVKELYSHTPLKDFSPRALVTIRDKMVQEGCCRKYVNKNVGRIKRGFKWGVQECVFPPTV